MKAPRLEAAILCHASAVYLDGRHSRRSLKYTLGSFYIDISTPKIKKNQSASIVVLIIRPCKASDGCPIR